MQNSSEKKSIPVTVFTGFLGAGKTTLILNLISEIHEDYNVVLLKNEFGDVKVDSQLALENNVKVTEMLNGCLCCVLVGQMKNALLEIRDKYSPDRIIVETSGSAFPAPIAWQIRELAQEGFVLDAIVTVIDCVHFRGYEDTSYTAKMQAKYTDLILLNKHELISEREMDLMLDHVYELNEDTPKVKCEPGGRISPSLVFGIDTTLFQLNERNLTGDTFVADHHAREIDLIHVRPQSQQSADDFGTLTKQSLESFLSSLKKEDVYRVKGLIWLTSSSATESSDSTTGLYILNWAFERYTLTALSQEKLQKQEAWTPGHVELVFMGRGLSFIRDSVQSYFSSYHVSLDEANE